HDATFANLALTNLGVIYERTGEYAKAAGAYQQAASLAGPEQVRAQLRFARMLARQGQKKAARAGYRGFLTAHPFAQQRQEVVESLAMLGAAAEAKPATVSNLPVLIPGSATTRSSH